jgi:hypothetical protein
MALVIVVLALLLVVVVMRRKVDLALGHKLTPWENVVGALGLSVRPYAAVHIAQNTLAWRRKLAGFSASSIKYPTRKTVVGALMTDARLSPSKVTFAVLTQLEV